MMAKAKTKDASSSRTAEQPRDEYGRLLDAFGLPENGPCRMKALAAIGLPDPRDDPKAWKTAAAPHALAFTDIEPDTRPSGDDAPQTASQDALQKGMSDVN